MDELINDKRLCSFKVGTHDGTSPCDLLQGLVAGTSPIVCADLNGVAENTVGNRSL